jgi:hypothetical protein
MLTEINTIAYFSIYCFLTTLTVAQNMKRQMLGGLV